MPNVEILFGPMLIGVFVNAILYGVLVVQVYVYWQTYKRDATWMKYFVFYMLIAETLNTGFDIGMMYEPLVIRWGSPHALSVSPKLISADPIMTVALSAPVQIFIAWRIWIISKSRLLTGIICFLAISSFIGGIATTVCVTLIPDYARFNTFDGAVVTWLAGSAAADVIITTSLVWSLYRRKTGVSGTDHIINRIIRLTVQTGMVTAFAATIDVTFFLSLPSTSLNFLWDFFLCKLYSNALMSTLNARGGWTNPTGNVATNVLFSNDSEPSNVFSFNAPRNYTDPRVIATGVYELEPPSISTVLSSQIKSQAGQDVEYGLPGTKAGEVQEDHSFDTQ